MSLSSRLRRLFAPPATPVASRRRFMAGLGGGALGAGFMLPHMAEAATSEEGRAFEERARSFGITPGTVVDAKGRPMRSLGNNPFIGEIVMFAGNFAPRGWALCDGQLLAISESMALFSILGTTYGGDGRATFGLPDLRGRVPLHPGTVAGLSTYSLGQRGGAETVTITPAQMPSHNHTATSTVTASEAQVRGTGTQVVGLTSGGDRGAATAATVSTTVGSTGGSQAHENRSPYLAINFIIATLGTFPS